MGENSDRNNAAELEWVRMRKEVFNEEPVATESKFLRKFKENPFIPIGVAATTVCLVMGLHNLRLRRSNKQQFYMRARVVAQGFTVAAFVAGLGVSAIKGN